MKVVHVQMSLRATGNAPYRLHIEMLKRGIDSKMIQLDSCVKSKEIQNVPVKQRRLRKIVFSLLDRFNKRYMKKDQFYFSNPNCIGVDLMKHPFLIEADVVYLHWIMGGFMNFDSIKKIFLSNKPVVFFLHDMWGITGGCHHSFDCKSYENNCYNCRMFKSGCKKTLASKQLVKKKKLFSSYSKLVFVSPSTWLDNCVAHASVALGIKHLCIPNFADDKIFSPSNKIEAKKMLGIETDEFVISYGCVGGVSNYYKGWSYLRDALNSSNFKKKVRIVIFGSDYDESVIQSIKYKVQFIGQINNEYLMSVVCNSSDLLVSPSLAESFSLTIFEHLLCGVPVVAFNVGGVPDLISHKENGYLAKNKDSKDLLNGIEYIMHNYPTILKPQIRTGNIVSKHISLMNELLEK